jgi:hypothetical protein
MRALSRIISGRLMTEEQIKAVTGGLVGKYLADWLPSSPQELFSIGWISSEIKLKCR